MKTLQEQITSAKRELALRNRVYPSLIQRGKLRPDQAQHEIECMEAIIQTLELQETVEDVRQGQLGLR